MSLCAPDHASTARFHSHRLLIAKRTDVRVCAHLYEVTCMVVGKEGGMQAYDSTDSALPTITLVNINQAHHAGMTAAALL